MMRLSIDQLFERLATRGHGAYGLSDVSQLDHALQSAALASEQGLGDTMIVAALFHDVGHMDSKEDVDLAAQGIDDRHEHASADMLADLFGPDVSEPVRLHVAAKRYLCGAEPGYYSLLAPDSRRSLDLQGGPMNLSEQLAFKVVAYSEEAVSLRRIDDAAKVVDQTVPLLDHYREMCGRG